MVYILTGYRLMVRTLDFHSNNVGSIPTGLKMSILKRNHINILYKRKRLDPLKSSPKIRYSFRFTSLIPPFSPAFLNSAYGLSETSPTRRIFLKKSFLVASWLFYLSSQSASLKKNVVPTIAILPAKKQMYTLTKAPMAHKTNSKEQFLFKFYNFKFSIELVISKSLIPQTLNQGAYSFSILHSLFPVFETNLLFLKYYQISYPIKDIQFFKHL